MGKTKEIIKKNQGEIVFRFKDDITGEGNRADPGANKVIGEMKGKGSSSFWLSVYFFEKLGEKGILNHLVGFDSGIWTMTVKKAQLFGQGLEFICRRFAYGSFLRRYGKYGAEEMQELPYLVEVTLKDDERGDPLINDDALVALGIITANELQEVKWLTQKVAKEIEKEIGKKGLELIDLKLEFGKINGAICLIDEISGDTARVRRREDGKILDQIEFYQEIFI